MEYDKRNETKHSINQEKDTTFLSLSLSPFFYDVTISEMKFTTFSKVNNDDVICELRIHWYSFFAALLPLDSIQHILITEMSLRFPRILLPLEKYPHIKRQRKKKPPNNYCVKQLVNENLLVSTSRWVKMIFFIKYHIILRRLI